MYFVSNTFNFNIITFKPNHFRGGRSGGSFEMLVFLIQRSANCEILGCPRGMTLYFPVRSLRAACHQPQSRRCGCIYHGLIR